MFLSFCVERCKPFLPKKLLSQKTTSSNFSGNEDKKRNCSYKMCVNSLRTVLTTCATLGSRAALEKFYCIKTFHLLTLFHLLSLSLAIARLNERMKNATKWNNSEPNYHQKSILFIILHYKFSPKSGKRYTGKCVAHNEIKCQIFYLCQTVRLN